MKHIKFTILLTILMSMVGTRAYAHELEAKNSDGVTIYYNWISYFNGLEVTYKGDKGSGSSSDYTGNVNIPQTVSIEGKRYRVERIHSSAFSGCSGLTSVTIPNSVTSIGNGAFYYCSSLTSVTIPNSVTSIDEYAFSGCSCLTSITIPNSVTSIGSYAFYDCSGLTSVTIPNSVTSIGASFFAYCSSLTSVTIPNSVTSIGASAFSGCSGLTSVTIPNSVTSIGNYIFRGCSGLSSVTLNSNSIVSKNYTSSNNFSTIFGSQVKEYIVGNEVKNIGEYAFCGSSGLTSVTIPNNVTSIGNYAFSDCSGLTSVTLNSNSIVSKKYTSSSNFSTIFGSQVTNYILGDEVTSIGDFAFFYCSGLTSITIPNSVTSIGRQAISCCSGLTSITIPNSVTSIDVSAFYGTAWYNNQPDGLVYAGKVAYSYKGTMPANTSISIKNGTLGIAGGAFDYCTGLTSITIPNSVTNIGDYAFCGCTGLTSVTIPNSVTSIGGSAFSGCYKLTSVTIGSGVTSIGKSAFYNCYNLKKVIVEDIAAWCGINFDEGDINPLSTNPLSYADHLYSDNNTEIKDLVIPDGVTSIGGLAFSSCDGLTSVTIPNSVTSIGERAFWYCDGITYVMSLNEMPPSLYSECFLSTKIKRILYVPTGCKEAYESSKWNQYFKNIQEKTQFNLTYIVDGEEYKTYELKGSEVITPEPDPIKEGYTFSGWSEIPSTMPCHDVTINGYFTKNGTSVYKPLDDYIANSVTSFSNDSYYISPTINNVERIFIDLTMSTTNGSYCYIGIKNKVNTKMIDFSSKYLQSTSSDNLVVYEGNNSIRHSIKMLANNNTYSWLYYNPENPNEVIIDVKAYFGCTGYIEKWQKNFGTSCVVNIETENAETSIHDIRDSSIKDDRYYNLQGQRVMSPKKGIYIINGKKVIIK